MPRGRKIDVEKYRIKSEDLGYEPGEDMAPGKNEMGRREERRKRATERMNLELNPGE